jgi:hypothetical protein
VASRSKAGVADVYREERLSGGQLITADEPP